MFMIIFGSLHTSLRNVQVVARAISCCRLCHIPVEGYPTSRSHHHIFELREVLIIKRCIDILHLVALFTALMAGLFSIIAEYSRSIILSLGALLHSLLLNALLLIIYALMLRWLIAFEKLNLARLVLPQVEALGLTRFCIG